MSTTQHPLTETDVADLWNRSVFAGKGRSSFVFHQSQSHIMDALRAAFDAGREHERAQAEFIEITEEMWDASCEHEREHAAQARPAEITDEMVEAAARATHSAAAWPSTPGIIKDCWRRYARAALTAALAVAHPAEPLARTLLAVPKGHGAPHHDAGRIKADDYVAQVDKSGSIRAGIAHHQDEDGDWQTEKDVCITLAVWRADRPDALTVWPAPTPPAVEVEWEPQFGDIITDIRYGAAGRLDRLVNAGAVGWADEAGHFWYLTDFTAFTLPDGTRVRRDGEHANGEPRFVREAVK